MAAAALDLTRGIDLSRLDLVVSNPPYVDAADAGLLSPEVCNFEPHLALFSPGRGTSTLSRLFAECAALRSGAPLVVEIGYGQLAELEREAAGSALEIAAVVPDYAGIPRVLILRRR